VLKSFFGFLVFGTHFSLGLFEEMARTYDVSPPALVLGSGLCDCLLGAFRIDNRRFNDILWLKVAAEAHRLSILAFLKDFLVCGLDSKIGLDVRGIQISLIHSGTLLFTTCMTHVDFRLLKWIDLPYLINLKVTLWKSCGIEIE
jgi:hypothetical protein